MLKHPKPEVVEVLVSKNVKVVDQMSCSDIYLISNSIA